MICDAELTLEELDSAVMCLSLDKSPGPDGITSIFYGHFWRVCLGVYILHPAFLFRIEILIPSN